MSSQKPEDAKKQLPALDRATGEEILVRLEAMTKSFEAMQARSAQDDKPSQTAIEPFDPKLPISLAFKDSQSRNVYETQRSALARSQKSNAELEANQLVLHSYQQGLDDIVLDVNVGATRLFMDFVINDKKFEDLIKSKRGSWAAFFTKHAQFLTIAIVLTVIVVAAIVRFTQPGILAGAAASLNGLSTYHLALIVGAVVVICVVAGYYIRQRSKANKPPDIGSVTG